MCCCRHRSLLLFFRFNLFLLILPLQKSLSLSLTVSVCRQTSKLRQVPSSKCPFLDRFFFLLCLERETRASERNLKNHDLKQMLKIVSSYGKKQHTFKRELKLTLDYVILNRWKHFKAKRTKWLNSRCMKRKAKSWNVNAERERGRGGSMNERVCERVCAGQW